MTPRTYPPQYFVGVDLGQSQDPTAIAVLERVDQETGDVDPVTWIRATRRRLNLRYAQRLPLGTPYPLVAERMVEVCQKLAAPQLGPPAPLPELVVDGTGVGRAVVDALKLRPQPTRIGRHYYPAPVRELPYKLVAVSITGGEQESYSDGFWRVPKRELLGALTLLFQRGELRISEKLPEYAVLVRELLNFRVKITASGNDTYGNWREAEHDDLVLAVALAAWRAMRPVKSAEGVQRLFW